MTEKLFYEDAYKTSFDACIVDVGADEAGRNFVVLDRTVFYPEGGGQPFDTGWISGERVLDVQTVDGVIRHYLEKESELKGGQVQGQIDWERRYDHMQQHAGQHILSAVFEELFGLKTTSFHLGEETVTIDLEADSLTEEMLEQAEKKANQIILENRPIEIKWMTLEEARRYPLRKQPAVAEDIRLVIIPEFDYNGCGGTHPRHTGEVMAVKLLKWERQRQQARLEFVCGWRVLKQLGQKQTVLRELSRLLNSPQPKMAEAAAQLLGEKKALQTALEEAKEELLNYEAQELLMQVIQKKGYQLLVQVFQQRPIQELQKLARLAVEKEATAVVLFVAENGEKLQLTAASGHQAGQVDLKQAAAAVFPLIKGKGGGQPRFIQGGGQRVMSGMELAEKFEHALEEAVPSAD
ncbi:alanyl-tRNA editing protein [Pseudobacillus badius]|uniref:alanyl-tRNA editing protein n=1 Tax=Bacillus badius TaxID=1455 RepID=UPI0007B03FE2|nr:alanine--tRNA ligase-related protein [Bacillus badius]KZN98515.1 alanyl-tRNA editing protein [Bacillus badius]OCS83212.1 alanyl-tRNA editing protein [Bacillus badius]OVE51588.1 alanyl-tRNA editing protein [Bacillus badius]TDW02833.1 alanyl-tRNA synthetase [Bacillus badius]